MNRFWALEWIFVSRGEYGCCDITNWLAPNAPWPIHRCKKDANFWKMNWISSCWLFLEIALSIGSVKFCMGLGMRTLSIDIKVGSESSVINTYYIITQISNHRSLRIPDFTHTHRTRVSVIRHEIYQCWNWYGSDLQTLEDQAHWVLKTFHEQVPR